MDAITAAIREGQRRRLAMSVSEAAIETGVGRDKIYGAIKDGRLEARKFGRRTIITLDALERFLCALPPLELPPKESAGEGVGPPPKRSSKPLIEGEAA
jgi:excisionase family DNA binding protein